MKCHILNYEPERMGGGWTQARYLNDGLKCVSYAEADVVIITGASMALYDQVNTAKVDGKKIVFRVDNALRPSRNRGTGMTRMKAFSDLADLIIYQSNWAREFLLPFTKKDGVVILNGVDTNRFKPNDKPEDTYLYVRSSRDEGKQWIMAWYWFVNHKGLLNIVGKFSKDNLEYNFDFYNDEKFRFWGEQQDMVTMYQNNKYFLYTYLNDACSNTLLEAKASGCVIIDVFGMLSTGGAKEIMECDDISLERMIGQYEQHISQLA